MDDIIDDMGMTANTVTRTTSSPLRTRTRNTAAVFALWAAWIWTFCAAETPEEVYTRAKALLLNSRENGHYMLGTGNSLARFLPLPQLDAMRPRAVGRGTCVVTPKGDCVEDKLITLRKKAMRLPMTPGVYLMKDRKAQSSMSAKPKHSRRG
jgi:hypothetical protein